MLVLAAVSSMNTSRAGSNMNCSRLQRRRARATSGRCCSAACNVFFKGEIVSRKKPPDCGAAARDAPLAHRGNDLVQRQIWLPGNQCQQRFRVFLQRRPAPSGGLCSGASGVTPSLQPLHCGAWTQIEALGGFPPRRSRFDCFNHAFPQIIRIRLRHCLDPQRTNQLRPPIGLTAGVNTPATEVYCVSGASSEIWPVSPGASCAVARTCAWRTKD